MTGERAEGARDGALERLRDLEAVVKEHDMLLGFRQHEGKPELYEDVAVRVSVQDELAVLELEPGGKYLFRRAELIEELTSGYEE